MQIISYISPIRPSQFQILLKSVQLFMRCDIRRDKLNHSIVYLFYSFLENNGLKPYIKRFLSSIYWALSLGKTTSFGRFKYFVWDKTKPEFVSNEAVN